MSAMLMFQSPKIESVFRKMINIVHWYKAIPSLEMPWCCLLSVFWHSGTLGWTVSLNCGLFRSTSHRSNDARALLFETNWKCCKAAWNNSQQRCGVGWLGDWQKNPVICMISRDFVWNMRDQNWNDKQILWTFHRVPSLLCPHRPAPAGS